MACLIVIEGPDARIVHEISHDVTLIGKNFGPAHREHLSLDKDTQVSGRNADGSRQGHAAVLRSGENYVLEDLGSLNGTEISVGEMRVRLNPGHRYALKDKDVLLCGSSKIVFWLGAVMPDGGEKDALARRAAGIRLSESITRVLPGEDIPTVVKPRK